MITFKYKSIKPFYLTDNELNQLVVLHQKQLDLPAEIIKNQLVNRDLVHLYYDENQLELIGTIGTQEIHLHDGIVMYYGNTVIDEQFKHSTCLAHAIQKSMASLFLRHPFKKKYHAALASSSGSFLYFSKFKPSWPNQHEETPKHVLDTMVTVAESLGGTYRCEKNTIISTSLCQAIGDKLHRNTQGNSNYFSQVNPKFNQGEQVMVLAEFTVEQMSNFMFYCNHDVLITNRKSYHQINGLRHTNPSKALMLMIYNIYLKKKH